MKLFAAVVLLLSLLSLCYGQCSPGDYYDLKEPELGCVTCSTGHYCPGGSTQPILCPDGTIAPNYGNSACFPCPFNVKRSDSTRTVCLLPNTPQDARNIEPNQVFDLKKGTNFYTTVKVYEVIPRYVEISVIGADGVEICVSESTGQPTFDNTSIKSIGKNATVIVDRVLLVKKEGFVLYLSIKPIGKNTLFTVKFNNLLAIYNVLPNVENVIAPTDEIATDTGGIITFNVDNVPIGFNLNITVQVQFKGFYVEFNLCHSSIKTIEYPNMENSDQIASYKRTGDMSSVATINIKAFSSRVSFSFVKPYPLSYPSFKITARVTK